MKEKITIAILLGILLMLLGWIGFRFVSTTVEELSYRKDSDQPPVIQEMNVSLPQAPTELPFVGKKGVDAFGYPYKKPDKVALRVLLIEGKYDQLTEYLNQFQQAYEADFRKEFWPAVAFDAFATSYSDLESMLNQWVKAKPKSWIPLVARGVYYSSVAWKHRGNKYASKTSTSQMDHMKSFQRKAKADLEQALAYNSRLAMAYADLIGIHKTIGVDRKELSTLLNKGLEHCPNSYGIRAAYMWSLQPRWGGTLNRMRNFATTQIKLAAKQNPRIQLLAGEPPYEECKILRSEKRYKEALEKCNEALSYGSSPFFHKLRGNVYGSMKNLESALTDYEDALAQIPQSASILRDYASTLWELDRWKEAGDAYLLAVQLDPAADTKQTDSRNTWIGALLSKGDKTLKKGERELAIDLYRLGSSLDLKNQTAQKRYKGAMMGKTIEELTALPSDTPQIAELRKIYNDNPNSFEAARNLDYALAKQGRLKEVEEIWNGFISRVPDNPRAYLERGGTYFHMRYFKKSRADAQKACDLGLAEGCTRVQQLKGR